MQLNSDPNPKFPANSFDPGLQRVIDRITLAMERDKLVQQTMHQLRMSLEVDRVVLYYFFKHWEGRVTSESISADEFSILGSTGPDQCFNGEYAAMYEAGRVRAIPDIETEDIAECHRNFLREMRVRANLVVPVLTDKGLWGLLVAHHCQAVRAWRQSDIDLFKVAATALSTAPSIHSS